jgi:hypothetical protein
MRIRTGILFGALVTASLSLGAAGCNKNKKDASAPKDAGDTSSSVSKVDPTLCETSGKNVITYDLNRDNRPDVWKMYKVDDQGGTKLEILTCKQVDFDHDGRKDWVVGYTPRGSNAFEKADFDYDGRFDMSAVYDPKTGKRIESLTAVRRDRNADGEPDYWEQYKDGALVAILYDDDFDKKVDRKEEVPGLRPKFVAPEPEAGAAESDIDAKPPAAGGTTAPAKPPAK